MERESRGTGTEGQRRHGPSHVFIDAASWERWDALRRSECLVTDSEVAKFLLSLHSVVRAADRKQTGARCTECDKPLIQFCINCQTPGGQGPPPSQLVPPPSQLAPPPSQLAPPSSQLAPPPSQLVPPPSQLAPPPSRFANYYSQFAPPFAQLAPCSSQIAPPPSQMASCSSHLPPPSSRHAPPLSHLAPLFSQLGPPLSHMAPPSQLAFPPSQMAPPPSRIAPPFPHQASPHSQLGPPTSRLAPPIPYRTAPHSQIGHPHSCLAPPSSQLAPPPSHVAPPSYRLTPPSSQQTFPTSQLPPSLPQSRPAAPSVPTGTLQCPASMRSQLSQFQVKPRPAGPSGPRVTVSVCAQSQPSHQPPGPHHLTNTHQGQTSRAQTVGSAARAQAQCGLGLQLPVVIGTHRPLPPPPPSQLPSEASRSTETSIPPSQLAPLHVQPSQPSHLTLKSSQPSQLTLQPSEISQLTLQPSETSQLTLQPSQPQLTVQPSETSQLTLQPSETSQLTLQPSQPQLTLQPSEISQLTLQPSKTSQLTLQPSETSQLTLQPSQQLSLQVSPLHLKPTEAVSSSLSSEQGVSVTLSSQHTPHQRVKTEAGDGDENQRNMDGNSACSKTSVEKVVNSSYTESKITTNTHNITRELLDTENKENNRSRHNRQTNCNTGTDTGMNVVSKQEGENWEEQEKRDKKFCTCNIDAKACPDHSQREDVLEARPVLDIKEYEMTHEVTGDRESEDYVSLADWVALPQSKSQQTSEHARHGLMDIDSERSVEEREDKTATGHTEANSATETKVNGGEQTNSVGREIVSESHRMSNAEEVPNRHKECVSASDTEDGVDSEKEDMTTLNNTAVVHRVVVGITDPAEFDASDKPFTSGELVEVKVIVHWENPNAPETNEHVEEDSDNVAAVHTEANETPTDASMEFDSKYHSQKLANASVMVKVENTSWSYSPVHTERHTESEAVYDKYSEGQSYFSTTTGLDTAPREEKVNTDRDSCDVKELSVHDVQIGGKLEQVDPDCTCESHTETPMSFDDTLRCVAHRQVIKPEGRFANGGDGYTREQTPENENRPSYFTSMPFIKLEAVDDDDPDLRHCSDLGPEDRRTSHNAQWKCVEANQIQHRPTQHDTHDHDEFICPEQARGDNKQSISSLISTSNTVPPFISSSRTNVGTLPKASKKTLRIELVRCDYLLDESSSCPVGREGGHLSSCESDNTMPLPSTHTPWNRQEDEEFTTPPPLRKENETERLENEDAMPLLQSAMEIDASGTAHQHSTEMPSLQCEVDHLSDDYDDESILASDTSSDESTASSDGWVPDPNDNEASSGSSLSTPSDTEDSDGENTGNGMSHSSWDRATPYGRDWSQGPPSMSFSRLFHSASGVQAMMDSQYLSYPPGPFHAHHPHEHVQHGPQSMNFSRVFHSASEVQSMMQRVGSQHLSSLPAPSTAHEYVQHATVSQPSSGQVTSSPDPSSLHAVSKSSEQITTSLDPSSPHPPHHLPPPQMPNSLLLPPLASRVQLAPGQAPSTVSGATASQLQSPQTDGKAACPHCSSVFETQHELAQHLPQCQRQPGSPVRSGNTPGDQHAATKPVESHSCVQDIRSQDTGQLIYTCTECHHSFATQEQMRDHVTSSGKCLLQTVLEDDTGKPTGTALHTCRFCNKGFDQQKHLEQHVLTHTNNRYKCEICDKVFQDEPSLREHSSSHFTSKESMQCDLPSDGDQGSVPAPNAPSLPQSPAPPTVPAQDAGPSESGPQSSTSSLQPQEVPTPPSPAVASSGTCGKIPKRLKDQLTADPSILHCKNCFKVSKTAEKHTFHCTATATCSHCDQLFTTLCVIRRHKRSLPGKVQKRKDLLKYPCNVCNKTFSDTMGLWDHRSCHWDERNYRCSICSKSFKTRRNVRKHEQSHTSNITYQCDKCGATLKSETGFKIHMARHAGFKKRPQTKGTACDQCEAMFVSRYKLKVHKEAVHSTTRSYSCQICPATFRTRDCLNKHGKIHTNLPRFRENVLCTVCGEMFLGRPSLKLHMLKHTGELPFKCKDCDAAFAQSISRDTHWSTHHGEKPHKCDQCDARFARKDYLKKHKNTHQGQGKITCNHCKGSFSDLKALKTHFRKHHKK